jgi:hypothetical protein
VASIPLASVALLVFSGCASGATSPASADAREEAEVPPSFPAAPNVQAGVYRLNMSTTCNARERTSSGTLNLERIAGPELLQIGEMEPEVRAKSDSSFLWGETDLDFESLRSCLGGAPPAADDPIHPSVLVEVLKWDGEPVHQVLLVSTDPRRNSARSASGAGVAMWVESAEPGHLAGIWSRWEVVGREEGRWDALLLIAK